MKTASLVGVLLVILGIVALDYQGITYTTHKKVLDVDSGRHRFGRWRRVATLRNERILKSYRRLRIEPMAVTGVFL